MAHAQCLSTYQHEEWVKGWTERKEFSNRFKHVPPHVSFEDWKLANRQALIPDLSERHAMKQLQREMYVRKWQAMQGQVQKRVHLKRNAKAIDLERLDEPSSIMKPSNEHN